MLKCNKLIQETTRVIVYQTISETRFLSLLGGQGFYGFQVEIVIQMQVVEVLTMNQQIEHVVALTTDLQSSFHPIESGGLEEFGRFE